MNMYIFVRICMVLFEYSEPNSKTHHLGMIVAPQAAPQGAPPKLTPRHGQALVDGRRPKARSGQREISMENSVNYRKKGG